MTKNDTTPAPPPPRPRTRWAARLRMERARRGWNRIMVAVRLEEAARTLRVGPLPPKQILRGYTYGWEDGTHLPEAKYQLLLAHIYGLSARELFGDAVSHQIPAALMTSSGSMVDLPHFAQAEDDAMRRRAFVGWLTALGAGSVALPESVRALVQLTGDQPDTLPAITMADVESLQSSLDIFKGWMATVGGGLSRHAVIGQLAWATHQIDERVNGTPRALHDWRITTARLADTAGWMALDAGRQQHARGYFTLGYQVASSVESRQAEALRAMLLSKLARQATYIGRTNTALELTRQCQSMSDTLTPLMRAMLHGVKARAYAQTGDLRAVDRELGLSEQEFGRATPDDLEREPWMGYFGEAQLACDRGTALQVLVRDHPEATDTAHTRFASRAATALLDGATGWSDEATTRSRVHCQLRAATALVHADELEQAVAVANQALPALPSLRSHRVLDDANALRHATACYRRRPDIAKLARDLTIATTSA